MCVILDKKLGSEIPLDVLTNAAKRNSDGYGVVIADRGQLAVFQAVADKYDTAADEVNRILGEAKDLPTMVHFRFATAGKRSLVNTHPFPLLTKEKHGVDVQLMHNGTMSHFNITGSDSSDTARMVDEVAAPLFERAWKYHDGNEEALMTDESLMATLRALVGYGVITFMSQSGWISKVNMFNGQDYDWGWASNKSTLETPSKDSWYRRGKDSEKDSSSKTFLPSPNASAWSPPDDWKQGSGANPEDKELQRALDAVTQGDGVKDLIRLSPHAHSPLPKPSTRINTKDFLRPYELSDLVYLDIEDIRDLIFECPEAAAVIFMDLLHELYVKNRIITVGSVPATQVSTGVETH